MNSPRPGSVWWSVSAHQALVLAVLALTCAAPHVRAQEFPAAAGWRDVSVAEYQQHLENLDALIDACQRQRAELGAAQGAAKSKGLAQLSFPACDPAQIGPDDRVQWPAGAGSERREVRYDWLRQVLARVAKKDGVAQPSVFAAIPGAKKPSITVNTLLTEARRRLQDDEKQVESPAEANPGYAGERKTLNAILSQKAYQGASEVSPRERFIEWCYNLLDKFLASLVRFGSRAPWIVFALRVLLLAGILTALIWFLVRIERRSRVRLIPDDAPAPGAPPAREWQLWLKDAQAVAAKGLWREAIHFLYWASIARLESRRVWPADRARTPREYLALMAGADPRKPNLAALTRSFERTWYGGRTAAASEFDQALEQAAALGVAVE
ncbi:MAG: DUF4129 domain-containing protein [Terracidiphilus sp.]